MPEEVVRNNKVVTVSYSLYDEKGDLFEYSDLPISYLHGSGSDLFPKIEQALEGHAVDDVVEIMLSPEDGFGQRDPALTFTDELENVPPELRRLGTELEAQNATGEILKFVVTAIDEEAGTLTVDANHALAGQTVRFAVTIKGIRDAAKDEIENGQPNAAYDMPKGMG